MRSVNLSKVVISLDGDRLYSFEQAAIFAETSVTVVEQFAALSLIEPEGDMLRARDIARIAQVLRLRRDLGLNLVGAGMVLDMAQEIARLRAQLQAYQSSLS